MHGIKKYFPLIGGFLLIVLTISLIVGYTYQENNQVTPKNPADINITIQGEKTSTVRRYLADLNEMNPNLLGYCNEIIFTDQDVVKVAGVEDQMESGYNYLAITTGDGTITLSSQKYKGYNPRTRTVSLLRFSISSRWRIFVITTTLLIHIR